MTESWWSGETGQTDRALPFGLATPGAGVIARFAAGYHER